MKTQTRTTYSESIAAEVRAEVARQRKTVQGLAQVLNVTQSTASRRFTGDVPFDMREIFEVAAWLGLSVTELDRRARETRDAADHVAVSA
ncbi:helix-turn-helix domain-containing protein [Cellulosimicrobium funkei]|uniref:helix-turn-helix domain-containing protein n=1 Tax=Cellulosimicrobium funkei TaxID=264251 RepID=UPI00379C80D1